VNVIISIGFFPLAFELEHGICLKTTHPTQTFSPVSAENGTIMRLITYRSIRSILEAIVPHCDRFGYQGEEPYVTRVKAQRRKTGVHSEKGTGLGTFARWGFKGIDKLGSWTSQSLFGQDVSL
jgi:hypothetical protein